MATASLCIHFTLLLLLLPHIPTATLVPQDDLVINTKHGKVQGKSLSVLGGEVRAFLGIPYGKPPLGELRFRPPQPVERWDGLKDSTNLPKSCYQVPDTAYKAFRGSEMWNPNTELSEDCLYLNVWAPRLNKTQNNNSGLAPVLVWIYGGGFNGGTSSLDIYDGRFLSKSEGVVVVSMNYRLGAWGFLSLPDNKNIRGNAGLLDQRLALRWVVDNIAAFGGDPSKVTLFGESAGSASVGFQLLSPGSQGLFQRGVMQSGSPNAPWATISQDEAWQRSLKLAALLGCPTSNGAQLEACLQKVDAWKLTSKTYDVFTKPSLIALPFVPVVDGDFLPDTVEALLSSGNLRKQELLFGLNKDEGTYFLMYGVPGFSLTGESLITRKDFLNAVGLAMSDSSAVAREAAISEYTDWSDENNKIKNRDLLGSLVGDQMFCSHLEFAERYSKRGGKSFLYSFDHRSSVNPWPEWMGVMHGYEIEFVFGMPLNVSLGYTKNEVNMTKKFMKHWANFARTGNPGIDGAVWPMFSHEQQQYVTLNYNHPEQKRMMRAKECHLWNKLMPSIQKVSDDLSTCVTANGIMLCCNNIFLIILLAMTLICL
ncbi:acetylcholinesterase-like [Labrus mixtus]|uniref:acetylcholinesterase-like n=1 Tax=Labrus mixtus TaxID=508554 RepID=UPI0029C022A7|nr:acetylcholinesterase-like [Labrus mixtus]